MKKALATLFVFAVVAFLAMIAFDAKGQEHPVIGEWHLIKQSCEGGKVLGDYSEQKNKRIFDKRSTTHIQDWSHIDKKYKQIIAQYF